MSTASTPAKRYPGAKVSRPRHPATPPASQQPATTMADATSASHAEPRPESLEALQARHRKEQRDLISRTTQKKKQASKKTRKGVSDECERLARELQERQARELAVLSGEAAAAEEHVEPSQGAEDEVQHVQEDMLKRSSQQPPQSEETSTNGQASGERSKKPNRAKARLARRAAETASIIAEAEREAANAPSPRELERERMATQLQQHGLAQHEIRADGHCLYAAVADQLHTREGGLDPKIAMTPPTDAQGEEKRRHDYQTVRYAAADWIQAHSGDFAGFTEDALPEHVRKIRETGEWGGHLELLALARTYALSICVLHSDGRVDRIESEEEGAKDEIWLGYYKHSHGLGEHYNSLRKLRGRVEATASLRE
jgi:OTU domain-containing protein 6